MQLATSKCEPFPHGGEARLPALFFKGSFESTTVVTDLELRVPRPRAQRHCCVPGVGVSLDVAKRFLGHAIQCRRQRGWNHDI